eukprot:CAMPEP_0117745214 /NCGR_PEP_ID=MMETSP0947-20121206/7220_1 /TAXON_ID=44440 /ORGANISM="Chattonella subsalsa, Strain CCMP2191" /LENGTH=374 /DNA_ID=CAMNT_0005562309 /DNA_START=235 /DNA_END=1359 /DNA_ORIENTATION=+
MGKLEFKKGDILLNQGDPQERIYVIAEGSVARLRYESNQYHHVETVSNEYHRGAFGSLHALRMEPTYATALTETDGVAYTLESETLNDFLEKDREVAKEMIFSLSKEVFSYRSLRTPLLEMDPKPAPLFATSIAATIESYYRSSLNALLNARLTGGPVTNLFPNFHIQIPTRIMYINGFKILRSKLSKEVDPQEFSNPSAVRMGLALVPGICMTPVSSILEACNADHMNKEPLWRRWTRGLLPRTAREVIFGVGINQLSELCEERVSDIENDFMRTCVGSVMAGSIAGYFSHVPHNLSTLKLLQPQYSYAYHWGKMVDENLSRIPSHWNKTSARIGSAFLSLFFPKGLTVRTVQIMGSFLIINGSIHTLTALGI